MDRRSFIQKATATLLALPILGSAIFNERVYDMPQLGKFRHCLVTAELIEDTEAFNDELKYLSNGRKIKSYSLGLSNDDFIENVMTLIIEFE